MMRSIIVIFDVYELSNDAYARRIQKWERVHFCEENTLYNDRLDYGENVRNFISDCINSQVVYIGEKYIPLHNIHGFYFDTYFDKENNKNASGSSNNQNNQSDQNNQNKRRGRFNKMRHRNHFQRSDAETVLPFKVEANLISNTSAPILPQTAQLPELV